MQIVNRRGGEVGVGGVVAVAALCTTSGVLLASTAVGVGGSPPSAVHEDNRTTNISKPARTNIILLNRNAI
jgi:hypothetical protein